MSSQITLFSHKSRQPKPGSGFLLVRLTGWLLKLSGILLIGSAILGFTIMLVKTIPTLIKALQYPEQKMAGFVILIILGGLLFFILLGLVGSILLGIGFVFRYWGTQSAVVSANVNSISRHAVNPQGQDIKDRM